VLPLVTLFFGLRQYASGRKSWRYQLEFTLIMIESSALVADGSLDRQSDAERREQLEDERRAKFSIVVSKHGSNIQALT
jgi:hypothetical protein